jgi:hypothetical protein
MLRWTSRAPTRAAPGSEMAPSDTGVASTQVAILGGRHRRRVAGLPACPASRTDASDRADAPPASRRWAPAVIGVRPLEEAAAAALLADSSETQDPRLTEHVRTYAPAVSPVAGRG